MRFWYGMFFGLVLGGLFLPRWGYAQVDTTRASELRQRGDSLYHVRQRSRARELFLAARADYEKAEAWSQSLHCQTMALACIPFGQRTAEDEAAFRAVIRQEQELALPSAEANTRRLLGIHFYVKQAWDSALYHLELAAERLEAQARTDSTLLGQIYQTKGYTLTQRGGSLREAEQWWRGVKSWEEAGRNDPVELSKVVLQMAKIQEKWGDRGQELALREEVMALREKALGPHHQLTGNAYHSLGSLYFMLKNYPRAQAYYEKAREAFATDPQYQEKRMALLLNDLAMTSYHLGKDAEGIAYLEESRRRLNALYGEGNPETIWIYSNLALFQTRAHDSVGALQSHYRALAIGQANYPGKSEVTGFNETEIGYHFLWADRYDSALVHFQRALHHSLPGFTDSDLSVLPQLEGVISEDLLANALELKAEAFWRRFQAAGDLRDLELAFANCRLLADYMLETRTGLASAEGQQFYADRTRDVLEIAVGVCYDLFQHTGEEKYAEAAFQFTEQSRSRQLMDGLQTALAREVVAIPDSLRALEDELRAQMAEAAGIVRRELSKGEAGDQAALTAARIERGKLMREHADFTATLKTTRPRYHRARYDRRRLTFAELRSTVLAVPRVLHSYFFVREDLYHLVLHPDSVEFIRHDASGQIVEQVEALCAHLRRPNFSGNWQARGREFARMGHALGRELLGPQAPGVPLIVIPDRALAYLPFEVLLTEAPAEEGFAYEDLAYLLQTHPVSYAFSAAHLRQVLAEEERATPRTCVAFAWSPPGGIATGPLAAAREATLGALPGSGEELRAISRSLEGDFYYGDSASKAAFLRHAGDPGILHLALHGEGNAEDPRDNRLRFPHRDSRGEEETLFLWELYGLQLAADLVVLSACETGLGKLQDGEGVMNLARGFAYAGTKSQVMSLWQMDDQSTAQIMGGFYEALAAGRSRVDALRQAKRGYLEAATGPDAHPYYWAGAQLVGDPGELPVATATAFSGKWGLLGIGLLLVLGGGIFWGMRRRMRPSLLLIGLAVLWLGGAGCSPVDPDTIPELVSVTYRHPTWPEDKYVTLYNSRDSTFIDAPEWQSEKTDTAYGLYRLGERLELEAVFRAKKDPGSVRIWARSIGRSPAKATTKFSRVGDEFRAKAQFKFAAPRKRQGVRIENFWLSWHTRIKGRRFAIGESNHKVYRVYDLPQPPMHHPAWTQVLDFACQLGKGRSRKRGLAGQTMREFLRQAQVVYQVNRNPFTEVFSGKRLVNMREFNSRRYASRRIIGDCNSLGYVLDGVFKSLGLKSVPLEIDGSAQGCSLCLQGIILTEPKVDSCRIGLLNETNCEFGRHVFLKIVEGSPQLYDPSFRVYDSTPIRDTFKICTKKVLRLSPQVYMQTFFRTTSGDTTCCGPTKINADSMAAAPLVQDNFFRFQELYVSPPNQINIDSNGVEYTFTPLWDSLRYDQRVQILFSVEKNDSNQSDSLGQMLSIVQIISPQSTAQYLKSYVANIPYGFTYRVDIIPEEADSTLHVESKVANCAFVGTMQPSPPLVHHKNLFIGPDRKFGVEHNATIDISIEVLQELSLELKNWVESLTNGYDESERPMQTIVWTVPDTMFIGERYSISFEPDTLYENQSIDSKALRSNQGNIVYGRGQSYIFSPFKVGKGKLPANIGIVASQSCSRFPLTLRDTAHYTVKLR